MSAEDATTDYALRVLYQAGVALSPEGVAVNVDERTGESPSVPAVRDALEGLVDRGLAEHTEGAYRLTDHGRDYVESELDQKGVGFIE